MADNMPYNPSVFRSFASDWGYTVTSSSPTYPQSNGISEKAGHTIKWILEEAEDPYITLLEYRNTPVTGMSYSPAQLLMSHATCTKLPVQAHILQLCLATNVKKELQACQERQVYYYNKGAKPLESLKPEEGVRIQNKNQWVPAQVKEETGAPRSYIGQE